MQDNIPHITNRISPGRRNVYLLFIAPFCFFIPWLSSGAFGIFAQRAIHAKDILESLAYLISAFVVVVVIAWCLMKAANILVATLIIQLEEVSSRHFIHPRNRKPEPTKSKILSSTVALYSDINPIVAIAGANPPGTKAANIAKNTPATKNHLQSVFCKDKPTNLITMLAELTGRWPVGKSDDS